MVSKLNSALQPPVYAEYTQHDANFTAIFFIAIRSKTKLLKTSRERLDTERHACALEGRFLDKMQLDDPIQTSTFCILHDVFVPKSPPE